jgi:hypothetical protein
MHGEKKTSSKVHWIKLIWGNLLSLQNNDNTKGFKKGIINMCLKWEGHKGPKGA